MRIMLRLILRCERSEPRRTRNEGIGRTSALRQNSPMTAFVYMLRCANGALYTGITKDVNRRCRQHNDGTASRYTRSRRPTCLVYQEAQPSRSLALRREAVIKALSRREKMTPIRLAG